MGRGGGGLWEVSFGHLLPASRERADGVLAQEGNVKKCPNSGCVIHTCKIMEIPITIYFTHFGISLHSRHSLHYFSLK